jgi:hypothetical protein
MLLIRPTGGPGRCRRPRRTSPHTGHAEAARSIAVDGTLFKRSGKKVFGAAWHHDGAAKGPKPIGFGNCRVVAGIVVQLPCLSRPVCLPVLARLWRPRHTGKIAHARQLTELIAARYPDRTVHVVGHAAYVGEHLRDLDAQITWTSRLKITSVLHELPPPRTGRSGDPAPGAFGWAPRPTWRPAPPPGRGGAPPGSVATDARHHADHRTGLLVVRLLPQPNRARHSGARR